MAKKLKRSVKPKNSMSSFTYYIPAPPSRKSGYREREFDKILTGILQSGFIIESLQTQSVGNEDGAGLFVIAVLRAPTSAIAKLDFGQDIQEKFKLAHSHSSPDIVLDDDGEFSDDL
ncbi:MAG TPA: hypothetical protein VNJ08_09490 [Bacteriovoracaceae bacterium]|nr:hypothetical protein [Bacteriovoracaceae bacterium]